MTYQESSSPKTRACVFIDNQNQLMTDTISVIKPRFPPRINLRELITRHVCSNKNNSGRSPNAFIIYRKALVDTARKDGYQLPMTIVSSIASKSWEREPEKVKEEYKRLAKEANEIRNKMIPKSCRKRKREKWNIVSFSPASYASSTVPKKSISKKRLSNKEMEPLSSFIPPSTPSSPSSSSSPSSPAPPENNKIPVGIPFDIPFDIVSPIIDTFESDDASFDDMYPNPFSSSDMTPPTTTTNPIFEQQQENWQYYNNSIQQELKIGEQSQDIFAFDIAPDETLGFDAFYNFEISYPSFWEI